MFLHVYRLWSLRMKPNFGILLGGKSCTQTIVCHQIICLYLQLPTCVWVQTGVNSALMPYNWHIARRHRRLMSFQASLGRCLRRPLYDFPESSQECFGEIFLRGRTSLSYFSCFEGFEPSVMEPGMKPLWVFRQFCLTRIITSDSSVFTFYEPCFGALVPFVSTSSSAQCQATASWSSEDVSLVT